MFWTVNCRGWLVGRFGRFFGWIFFPRSTREAPSRMARVNTTRRLGHRRIELLSLPRIDSCSRIYRCRQTDREADRQKDRRQWRVVGSNGGETSSTLPFLSRHLIDSNSKRLQGVLIRVNILDAATSSFPHVLDRPPPVYSEACLNPHIQDRAGKGESRVVVVEGTSYGITRVSRRWSREFSEQSCGGIPRCSLHHKR